MAKVYSLYTRKETFQSVKKADTLGGLPERM